MFLLFKSYKIFGTHFAGTKKTIKLRSILTDICFDMDINVDAGKIIRLNMI